MDMNAREAMHVIELRTAPAGHRRVCQQMHTLIRERRSATPCGRHDVCGPFLRRAGRSSRSGNSKRNGAADMSPSSSRPSTLRYDRLQVVSRLRSLGHVSNAAPHVLEQALYAVAKQLGFFAKSAGDQNPRGLGFILARVECDSRPGTIRHWLDEAESWRIRPVKFSYT